MAREIKQVMSTNNGHNRELVRKINYLFNDESMIDNFALILETLAQRDALEIKEKLDIEIECCDDAIDNASELLMQICDDNDLEVIINFCNPHIDDNRQVILEEIARLVTHYGGLIEFPGDFEFVGDDGDSFACFCEGNKLNSMLMINGTLHIQDTFEGEKFDNSANYLPDFELARILEYVKKQVSKKFTIRASAVFSRDIEVEAESYEEAVEKAKAELKANPWEEGDNNGTQFN